MIKANELRIGNWVNLRGDNMQVDGGDIYDLQDSENLDAWNPIPLTPEILEKCRFLKDNGNRFIKYTGEAREFLKIYLGDKLEDMWGKYQQVDMYIMFDHIKSLHQLQNLFFALTGEELQVNIHDKTQTT